MRRQGQDVARVVRAVVAALVGVAVLSGCTGEPEPAPTTVDPVVTPSRTPTPSPPPRPDVPEVVDAMAPPSPEGAVAAATHFLDLHRYAFMSGDASQVAAMSAPGCQYCEMVVADVAEAVSDELLTDRDPSEIVDATATEIRPGEWYTATLRVRQGEVRLLGDDGSVLAVDDTHAFVEFVFSLSWVDARWLVDAVHLAEAEA